MKRSFLFVFLFILLGSATVHAQKITPGDLKRLRAQEDTLKDLARHIYTDTLASGRLRSDSQFVRTLVRSLQARNSFYYPFDEVLGVSKLYAPDSTFRIFTWQVTIPTVQARKRGAIQLRTPDGSLKLIPLHDVTEFTEFAEDSVRTRANWIGAVYYNLIKTTWNGKPYYTLFGIDDRGFSTKRKWIEVLTFDEGGQPRFGGDYFDFSQDTVPRKQHDRFQLAYKREANVTANWDEDQKLILFDHLVSESSQPDLPYTMVPDGDSEGFKWEKGRWVHIDKVFHYKVDMSDADPLLGKPPVGDPILDSKGNINEEKLKQRSERNGAGKKKDNE
ncbi:hypothetical protein [Flaviaesturariibacter aridisoli]|uniref:Outer membrane lipoprotein-sorting protein n=1 Tax=Flaviaesturariibacter aridisoli TaxID=2545761 RepID=A0A4R4DYQ2_9BACT|nr:hypothetical protein [Flaviaesturariibacter aridisoli]TCZ69032.1 hypothetical protein E0486_12680 [Flaviaesturariibacter aridisoli]